MALLAFNSRRQEWQDESEKDGLLKEPAANAEIDRPRIASRPWIYIIVTVFATNILSILSTYSLTKALTANAYSQDPDGTSKVYPQLDRSLSMTNFSNHVLNSTSRWSAPPSTEVDHAWNELGVKNQIFLLPEELGREVYGLDPKIHVFAPKDALGEGTEGGFGVFIQGLHDMHCLNELRRALYFNKPYYKRFEDDNLTLEWARVSHIRHCLDNIRERLMCTADVGVIPTVWTGKEENYPQFKREHKCHSYDALMEWFNSWNAREEQTSKIDWTVHLSAPEDAIITELD